MVNVGKRYTIMYQKGVSDGSTKSKMYQLAILATTLLKYLLPLNTLRRAIKMTIHRRTTATHTLKSSFLEVTNKNIKKYILFML